MKVIVSDEDNPIIWINNNIWSHQDAIDACAKAIDKFERDFFYRMVNGCIDRKKEESLFDRLKLAWVKVSNTEKMCWVDETTMMAYNADGYKKTYIEIPKFTFNRWCTSFDL